jgi:hypothetical protein
MTNTLTEHYQHDESVDFAQKVEIELQEDFQRWIPIPSPLPQASLDFVAE